jgi:hypothetical protein
MYIFAIKMAKAYSHHAYGCSYKIFNGLDSIDEEENL